MLDVLLSVKFRAFRFHFARIAGRTMNAMRKTAIATSIVIAGTVVIYETANRVPGGTRREWQRLGARQYPGREIWFSERRGSNLVAA